MSRAAILDALRDDTPLSALVPEGNIIANPQGDGRPGDLQKDNFIVLRWMEQDWDSRFRKGPRNLEVWAHTPKEISDSYNEIDSILLRVTKVIDALELIDGADGWRITMAYPGGGWSGDLVDPAYNTIMKNALFKVLSNPIE